MTLVLITVLCQMLLFSFLPFLDIIVNSIGVLKGITGFNPWGTIFDKLYCFLI